MKSIVFFLNLLLLIVPTSIYALTSNQIELNEKTLNFVYSGDKKKQPVLFIHGTPGDWGAFHGYLANSALQKEFFLVSIDRLGWGKSKLLNKRVETSFAQHSEAIGALIKDAFPDIKKQWIIVGHSLGASLAPKIAHDFPDKISGLLLLSGSISPSLGKPRWYNYGASTSLIQIFLSRELKRANKEIMHLKKELKLLEPDYHEIDTKITVIQGAKDRLVSPKNAAYVADKFAHLGEKLDIQILEEANHFLPWNQQQTIIDALFELKD